MLCPICGQQNGDAATQCISCGHDFQHGGASIDTSRHDAGGMVVAMGASGEEDVVSPDVLNQAMSAPETKPAPLTLSPGRIYGNFWHRFLAWSIDAIILGIVQSVVASLVMLTSMSVLFSEPGKLNDPGTLLKFAAAYGFLLLFGFVLSLLYFVLCERSSWQGTLGKLAVGLKVTDTQGARISFGRALGRYCAHFFSNVTLGVGYLVSLFTGRRQALHDLIAGTLVVQRGATAVDIEQHPRVPATTAQRITALGAWLLLALFWVLVTVTGAITSMRAAPGGDRTSRISEQVYEAEMLGAQASGAVSEYFDAHGRFPATLADADFRSASKAVDRIWINGDSGTIFVQMGFSPLRKKILMLVPETDGDGDQIWRCSSDDIDSRYLPEHCRR